MASGSEWLQGWKVMDDERGLVKDRDDDRDFHVDR
jgi:hypothetical protein